MRRTGSVEPFALPLAKTPYQPLVVSSRVRTDSEGYFQADLVAHNTWHSVRLSTNRGSALLDLGHVESPRRLQLGDVRLGEGPSLAVGRVVDDEGRPVEGARVFLFEQQGPNWVPPNDPPRTTTTGRSVWWRT